MIRRIPVLLLSLLLDELFGDPPNRWHPVAWMGRFIARAQHHAPPPSSAPAGQMLYGAGVILTGSGFVAGAGALLARTTSRLPRVASLLLEVALLKTTFSLHGLTRAAGQIADALEKNDLPAARHWLSWHLVSRNTEDMDVSHIAAAVIESVAENASDGIVAPLFFYMLGGLPAALTYRFLNTADAMLGYRDTAREWLGKIPARVDDVVNLIPARLTALLLWAATSHHSRAWRIWQRDAHLTESPNAGHPMSAMAGALGVQLEKSGHYTLGADLRPPQRQDIPRAVRLIRTAVAAGAFFLALSLLLSRKRSR